MVESSLVKSEGRLGWRFAILSNRPCSRRSYAEAMESLEKILRFERLFSLSGWRSKPSGGWQRAVRKLGKDLHYDNPLIRVFVGTYECSVGFDELLL